eukprot:scaffold22580_cov91-Isochrysis_galbana.AAC.4
MVDCPSAPRCRLELRPRRAAGHETRVFLQQLVQAGPGGESLERLQEGQQHAAGLGQVHGDHGREVVPGMRARHAAAIATNRAAAAAPAAAAKAAAAAAAAPIAGAAGAAPASAAERTAAEGEPGSLHGLGEAPAPQPLPPQAVVALAAWRFGFGLLHGGGEHGGAALAGVDNEAAELQGGKKGRRLERRAPRAAGGRAGRGGGC